MKLPQTIYYLDDDTDDLYFFKETAETMGHTVKIFVSGTKMVQDLEREKLPDLIFLDIFMPVFDGEQILDIIKKSEQWKHIPVIMISGIYSKSSVRKYLQSGANYLMKKPTTIDDFKSSLEQIISIDWENFQAYC